MPRRIKPVTSVSDVLVGHRYLVPTVSYDIGHGLQAYPVMGPKHRDVEDFNFDIDHYHYDLRFFARAHFKGFWSLYGDKAAAVLIQPLSDRSQYRYATKDMLPLPDPVWLPLECKRITPRYSFGDRPLIRKLNVKYAGEQSARAPMGWLCPHRKAALNGQPVIDGVITCPLHGLRIDAETGRCLGPAESPPALLPEEVGA